MIATLTLALTTLPTLNISIVGDGYLQLETANGNAYAKKGSFAVRNGLLTHESGFPLTPKVVVPSNASSIDVTDRGVITAILGGSKQQIAQISLARFPKDAQPVPAKGVLIFLETPTVGQPAANGFGIINKAPNQITPLVGNAQIVVKERTDVIGSQITVGDIAEVSASEPLRSQIAAALVGPSPALETPRVITVATIQSALRNARVPLEKIDISVAPRSVVFRAGQDLSGAQVTQALAAWLEAQRPELPNKQPITPIADRRIPTGDVNYSFKIISETERSIVIGVEARVLEERIFGLQAVINKTAAAQTAVPTNAKIGQPVQILLISGGITVETIGKISWVGPDGRVKVTVEPNRTEMIGTIRADGIVEVKI